MQEEGGELYYLKKNPHVSFCSSFPLQLFSPQSSSSETQYFQMLQHSGQKATCVAQIMEERLEDQKIHFFFSSAIFQQFDSLLGDFATSPTYDLSVQLCSNSTAIHSRLTLCL